MRHEKGGTSPSTHKARPAFFPIGKPVDCHKNVKARLHTLQQGVGAFRFPLLDQTPATHSPHANIANIPISSPPQ